MPELSHGGRGGGRGGKISSASGARNEPLGRPLGGAGVPSVVGRQEGGAVTDGRSGDGSSSRRDGGVPGPGDRPVRGPARAAAGVAAVGRRPRGVGADAGSGRAVPAGQGRADRPAASLRVLVKSGSSPRLRGGAGVRAGSRPVSSSSSPPAALSPPAASSPPAAVSRPASLARPVAVSRPRSRVGEPAGGLWSRLTDRDRRVLALVDRHTVLTTDQLLVLEFGSLTRAQHRLAELRRLDVLWRFRHPLVSGGSRPWHYTVGYTGARLLAAQHAVRAPRPGVFVQRLERIAESPTLRHLLGTNQFFVDLAGYARRAGWPNPNVFDGDGLDTWRSEKEITALYSNRVHPDGYGCWSAQGRRLGFYLEYDTGSEPLWVLAGKLEAYAGSTDRHRSSYTEPTAKILHGMLLFWLPSARREANVRRALAGRYCPVPVATAFRAYGDPDGPAGPVWAVLNPARYTSRNPGRLRLADLPAAIGGTDDIGRPVVLDHTPDTGTAADRDPGYPDEDGEDGAYGDYPERGDVLAVPVERRDPRSTWDEPVWP